MFESKKPLEQSENGQVTVRIERASRSDSGQYLCYGFPQDRSTYLAKSINVVVGGDENQQDSGDRDQSDARANVDGNVDLSCSLSESDPYELKWRRIGGVSSSISILISGILC